MDPISAVLGLVNTAVSRIWPDKTAEGQAKLEALKAELTAELQLSLADAKIAEAQIEVNKAEAENPSLWVSGARPFIMWVCGGAFAWAYLLEPIVTYLVVLTGHPVPVFPKLGMEAMMPVLMGMLGLGSMRSFERYKGVIPKGR